MQVSYIRTYAQTYSVHTNPHIPYIHKTGVEQSVHILPIVSSNASTSLMHFALPMSVFTVDCKVTNIRFFLSISRFLQDMHTHIGLTGHALRTKY